MPAYPLLALYQPEGYNIPGSFFMKKFIVDKHADVAYISMKPLR